MAGYGNGERTEQRKGEDKMEKKKRKIKLINTTAAINLSYTKGNAQKKGDGEE
jgi:hypothetical protein